MKIQTRPKSLFLTIGAIISVTAGVVLAFSQTSNIAQAAAGQIDFSLFATHPYASQSIYNETSKNYYTGVSLCAPLSGETTRTCPVGQTITDMAISNDGQLVAGYGDWNSNSDSFGVQPWSRVGVVPLNISTSSWGSIVYAGSESLNSIRKFDDGTIYTTTTDPSDKVATGQTQNNRRGFITNASGDWQFMSDKGTAVHVFDTAKDDKGYIWVFGAIDWNGGSEGAAAVWRTKTGNDAWEQMKVDNSTGTSYGYERYYWGAFLNGKVYMQARGTNPATPMRVYDTAAGTWSDSTVTISNYSGTMVDTFDNHIVYTNGSSVNMFDGDETVTTKTLPNSELVRDLTKYDGKLYVLTYSGKIFSMASANSDPVLLGTASGAATSPTTIALYDNYIYLGGANGKIWRSNIKTTEIQSAPATVSSISPTALSADTSDGQIVINGDNFVADSTVKIGDIKATVTTTNSQTIRATANLAAIKRLMAAAGVTSRTFDVTVTNPLGVTTTLTSALTVTTTTATSTRTGGQTASGSAAQGESAAQASQQRALKTVGLSSLLAQTGVAVNPWLVVALFAAATGAVGLLLPRRRRNMPTIKCKN